MANGAIQTQRIKFGDPGSESWFGGPGTAEWLEQAAKEGEPRWWLNNNKRSAMTRVETLPEGHPFRESLVVLRELRF